jgi:hypothetical protein
MPYLEIMTRGRTNRLNIQHPAVRPVVRLREQNELTESDNNK